MIAFHSTYITDCQRADQFNTQQICLHCTLISANISLAPFAHKRNVRNFDHFHVFVFHAIIAVVRNEATIPNQKYHLRSFRHPTKSAYD